MTSAYPQSRQGLVSSWMAQMIGTLVLCGAVVVLMKTVGPKFASDASDWKRFAMAGILLGAAPALLYLRWYKVILLQDLRLERERGSPDPGARRLLQRSLILGGALCEVPMAMGVVQLFFGGDMRWFMGATLVTIALRLSYRPFERKKR